MVSRTHLPLRADDRSYFAILKKEIHALALEAGFSETRVGETDIIVAELTSNLAKHAGGGTIWVKRVEEDGIQGIEIISVDNGPGMHDVGRMMTDGFSTKNTLGHGLGAMKRMADVFEVFSQKGWGTVLLVRVFAEPFPTLKRGPKAEIRSVVLPKPNEVECGDGFFYKLSDEHYQLFLGDGLGHGIDAAAAVLKAGLAFEDCPENEPVEIIRFINDKVKKTRGLVGTVAVFNRQSHTWRICGVGNISTKLYGPSFFKSYMSYNGIIGLNVPNTLNSQEITHERGQYLVMCSDGLKSRWDAIKYPGIVRYDLTLLAASLMKDFARYTDDMSVVACKINV
ncbi:MAG: ATP-binding protein/SpoIIE family protein phosphatase [Bacteroidota bacterium]|nr:ATP-binding protein/SpoIIE family protein phosphatase [Bacteroidota bacterium]